MYDPKVSVIWEIIRDFFDAQGCADRRRVLHAPTSCRSTALRRRRDRHRLELAAGVARRAAPIRRTAAAPSPCATPIAIASRYRRGAAQRSGADAGGPARPHDCHRRDRLAAGDAHPARPPAPRGARAPERDVTVRRFDVLVGKHGDHVGGERDALRVPRRRARPRRARCST